MFYSIYRNNVVVARVEPLPSSELSQKKQEEDVVNLNFDSDSYIDLKIGDYIIIDKTEQKYFLNILPQVADDGPFRYECRFEGSLHTLASTTIMLDKDFNFPLTGNAYTFLQFIVENLNRNGGVYSVGKYKDTSDITVDFANWNALEAVKELSSLLGFDWYLEGAVLNFDAKDFQTPYTLHVGMKKGLRKLVRTTVESESVSTIVYGYGSTENLPPRTGEGLTYDSPLLTENRLYFEGVDGDSKLEKNVDLLGRREEVVVFDDIKPERTGVITGIDEEDSRIFYDDALDFDINEQKMESIKPKIKFISGALLGLQFNISYDDASKKITMDTFTDDSGVYPNDVIKPGVGDEYKLFDIIMPQEYIDDATTRLEEATQTYLDEHSKSMVVYEGEIDPQYIEANKVSLDIGDIIRVVSGAFAIDESYEIKSLVQLITEPSKYKIQFGDTLPKGLIAILQQANFNVQNSIHQVNNTQITNKTVTNNNIQEGTTWQTL
jgi:hypothetical protein